MEPLTQTADTLGAFRVADSLIAVNYYCITK